MNFIGRFENFENDIFKLKKDLKFQLNTIITIIIFRLN